MATEVATDLPSKCPACCLLKRSWSLLLACFPFSGLPACCLLKRSWSLLLACLPFAGLLVFCFLLQGGVAKANVKSFLVWSDNMCASCREALVLGFLLQGGVAKANVISFLLWSDKMSSSCREALLLGFLLPVAWFLVSVATCRREFKSSSHQQQAAGS